MSLPFLCDILGGFGENFAFWGGHFSPGPRQDKDSPPRDLGKIMISWQNIQYTIQYTPMEVLCVVVPALSLLADISPSKWELRPGTDRRVGRADCQSDGQG